MVTKKGISIVVCCYNASARIERTLEHLQLQNIPNAIPWEVIVIDNASTDDTAEKAIAIWERNPVTDFKVVKELKPGLNNARMKGFDEAAYSIVSLVDDDNWVESFWVEKVYNIFEQHKNVGACAGQNIPVFDTAPPAWFPFFKATYATGKLYFNEGIVDKNTFGNLWGAGLSIRKKIIDQLQELNFTFITTDRKGNSLSSGGDTELCYAIRLLGYDLYHDTNLTLQHFIPAARLEWHYLKRLNYELGKLHIIAGPYYYLYHKKPQKPWYIMARNALIMHMRYRLLRKLTRSQKDKWRYRIKAIHWKGKLDQILDDKGKDQKLFYQRLQQTFKTVFHKERSQHTSYS